MGWFTADDTLKVVVIGNDGIMRGGLYPRNSRIIADKYVVTPKDIFLQRTKKHFWMVDQPTIIFRENNVNAISRDGKDSFPSPTEMSDTIENAAMHLFTLFGQPKSNIWMILILIAALVAAGCAGASAYMEYNQQKEISNIHSTINEIDGILSNSSYNSPTGGIVTTVPRGIVSATVIPTPAPTITRATI